MGDRFRPALALGLFLSSAFIWAPAQADETVTYSYDDRGRLVGVSRSGTINDGVSAAYAYDKADNRTNVTVTADSPTFAINDVSVTEGGTLSFTVTRSGPTGAAVGVSYATANGTATAGSDYTTASGTLSFASGQVSKSISVTTIDDAASESSETVLVNLTSPTGGAVIGDAQGVGTINDNDASPACQGVSFAVSSNGAVTEGVNSVFTITKTGTATGSCAVSYASVNGTATAGSDYTAASGTLTFTTAQTSQTVSVATTDDATVESAETFNLNLSGATNGATIGTAAATATINDNDGTGPTFAINDASGVEGATLVFTVTKTGSNSSNVTINYATATGTAGTGDFTSTSGTLTFGPSDVTKTISVVTKTDIKVEINETFTVNLTGGNFTDPQGLGTIIDDGSGGCTTCLQSNDPPPESSDAAPPPPDEG